MKTRGYGWALLALVLAGTVAGSVVLGGCAAEPKDARAVFERSAQASEGLEGEHMVLDVDASMVLASGASQADGTRMSTTQVEIPLGLSFDGDMKTNEALHGTFSTETDISAILGMAGAPSADGRIATESELYAELDDKNMTFYMNVADDSEGWKKTSIKLGSSRRNLLAGADASDEFFDHAKMEKDDDAYVVSLDLRDFMADPAIRKEALKDVEGDKRERFEKSLDAVEGTAEYRFDAKTGYLTEVKLDDVELSMAIPATQGDMEIRFSGDATVKFSKFNEVDTKKVTVPSFVKDSATEPQTDEGAAGLLDSGGMYPGLVAATVMPQLLAA